MTNAVLTGRDLVLGYAAKPSPKVILSDLQVALYPGELVALLGPNGVGKSTLLRTLAGLQKPLGGTVQLQGKPIHRLSPEARARQMSLVLTDPLQVGNLRVRELVALGRYPHTGWGGRLSPTDVHKVEEAIAVCRIEYLAHERWFEISDGQRQKAMIARALAQDGPVMLLDEPTAHLDLPNKGEIMHLLHELARNTGKAILVSTHDLHLAMQMADRLMLADCVEPLETGMPEDLMLQGRLSRLFDHPQFQLDVNTGQYRLRREGGRMISVEGPDPACHWLTLALEKQGYQVQAGSGGIAVSVSDQSITYHWKGDAFASMENLLKALA